MRRVKFFLASLVILFVAVSASFAYDGTVELCRTLGTVSYDEFIESFDDDCEETTAQFLGTNYGSNYRKLFLINSENIDNEDRELLSDLEVYLTDKFDAPEYDVFQTLVIRTNTEESVDGWVIYSQWADGDWAHYMVYFAY